MTKKLHAMLQQENPTNLRDIERAFEKLLARSSAVEVCLSVLRWVRCTGGGRGLLGSVTRTECACRVSRLADDLDTIGATSDAAAFRELRAFIPLSDDEVGNGLTDWVDTQPEVIRLARSLDKELADLSTDLWVYMRINSEHLPDVPVGKRQRMSDRLRSFLSGKRID